MRASTFFATIAIPLLVALAPSSVSGEELVFGKADEGDAYNAMMIDLDGDQVRELLAIDGDDLYVYKKAGSDWVRMQKVVPNIKATFGSSPPVAVIGSVPPNDTIPYEIAVVSKHVPSPIVRFHNPYYKNAVPPPRNGFFSPPKMIST